MIVVQFYIASLGQGFLVGLFVRIIWSMLFKSKMTPGGLLRTGIFFAIVNVIIDTIGVLSI